MRVQIHTYIWIITCIYIYMQMGAAAVRGNSQEHRCIYMYIHMYTDTYVCLNKFMYICIHADGRCCCAWH